MITTLHHLLRSTDTSDFRRGSIVQSMYDMALLSWHLPLSPPLPLLKPDGDPKQTQFQFGDEHQHIKVKHLDKAAEQAREMLQNDEFSKDNRSKCFLNSAKLGLSRTIEASPFAFA